MYCGIDLGSTNIKIAIYNEDFCLVDRQSRPVEYIRDGGFVEFDAAAYCQILVDLLAAMVKENNISSIRQIAFTGQAESLVVLGADGAPLMNAISWMDDRSAEECARLAEQFSPAECERITGQQAVLPHVGLHRVDGGQAHQGKGHHAHGQHEQGKVQQVLSVPKKKGHS